MQFLCLNWLLYSTLFGACLETGSVPGHLSHSFFFVLALLLSKPLKNYLHVLREGALCCLIVLVSVSVSDCDTCCGRALVKGDSVLLVKHPLA